MSAIDTIAALRAALAAERNVARAVFHATYDDGPDARAAALAAGLAAYRDALPGASTHDGLARLDAAIIAVIAVTRDADTYIGGAP
jgi:hypothetical protein